MEIKESGKTFAREKEREAKSCWVWKIYAALPAGFCLSLSWFSFFAYWFFIRFEESFGPCHWTRNITHIAHNSSRIIIEFQFTRTDSFEHRENFSPLDFQLDPYFFLFRGQTTHSTVNTKHAQLCLAIDLTMKKNANIFPSHKIFTQIFSVILDSVAILQHFEVDLLRISNF